MKYEGKELYHYGTRGMKRGVRRYQNPDGTLTAAGQARYNGDSMSRTLIRPGSFIPSAYYNQMNTKPTVKKKRANAKPKPVEETPQVQKPVEEVETIKIQDPFRQDNTSFISKAKKYVKKKASEIKDTVNKGKSAVSRIFQ